MKTIAIGILLIVCGVFICYTIMKLFIKDWRIRRNSQMYEGIITGAYISTHVKTSTSFCPYVEVKELNKTLKCIRSNTYLFKNKEAGYYKKMKILYNPEYPNECTKGSGFSTIMQLLLYEFIGILLLILGIKIMMIV